MKSRWIAGLALVAVASGLILGLGPHYAEKLVAEMIEADQKTR